MLVTRYDGVWIIVLAFNEAPVIADVVSVDDCSHDDNAARTPATGAGARVEEMTRIWDRSQMTRCETTGIISDQSLAA
ncbi:MAG: hypothetical protein QOE94_2241 [Mycobacterium sp.]|jgi:hypothetical protein|nr:hypothetical protein [Mycobacterium sp.]